jgi:hypothetical protein
MCVLLVAAGALAAGCAKGSGVANDFCSSYGGAMHDLVLAARQYQTYPANFTSIYKSTMDRLSEVRSKAPDDQLRTAFDKAAFTFSVFGGDADLADFLSRTSPSENAVVQTCSQYGVDVTF